MKASYTFARAILSQIDADGLRHKQSFSEKKSF